MTIARETTLINQSELRLTNTLTKRKEIFKPINKGHVNIYCCGVTVYDLCHLGHARSYIAWDYLRRYLIWLGFSVKFVQNFTDIDDKILARAAEEGCSMSEVSERNIEAFYYDMDSLQIIRPDSMPCATKSIESICAFIKELEDKGLAYSVDGDVYFSVNKYSEYGKLSGRELKSQKSNSDGRIAEKEVERKKNIFDFALWKAAKPGETSFPSPWGKGRPGWHIECSAMVRDELGKTIDIHLGGSDLIFPHHENEIAQSECANGTELARVWLHNGMVNVNGTKMSKSLGNFTTIRSLLESGVSPMTLRFFVLQAHYRKPLDFTRDALQAASKGWKGLNLALNFGTTFHEYLNPDASKLQEHMNKNNHVDVSGNSELMNYKKSFMKAMDDDLNTSGALAIIFEIARPLRSLANQLQYGDIKDLTESIGVSLFKRWKLLIELSSVLGLASEDIKKTTPKERKFASDLEITAAIQARQKAKLSRDYDKADQIRRELREIGVELIDKKEGETEWIRN